MRILGLDPGSRHTGFGVIDVEGSRLRPVDYGRITLSPEVPLADRLVRLSGETRSLVVRLRPDVAVLEALYHGVNPRSLIVLAQARGVLVATLGGEGLPIHEYSPAEIKAAVTGHGRADKQQVTRLVRLILGLGPSALPSDAGDALATAICYARRRRLDQLSARGSAPDPKC